jgi:hypothetical protein
MAIGPLHLSLRAFARSLALLACAVATTAVVAKPSAPGPRVSMP